MRRPGRGVPQRRRAAGGSATPATLRVRSGSGAASFAVRGSVRRRRPAAGGDGHRRRAGRVRLARPRQPHRRAAGARRASATPCCASCNCRRACAPPRRTKRRSASPTCRAPTASTSPCWRWWRCSPAPSWCSRSCRCRWPGGCRSSRCSACWAWPRASGCCWCWPSRPLIGVVGSVLGLALGTALAALALRLLAGDLGGGYFPGVTPSLQFSAAARGGVRRAGRDRRRWPAAGCRPARRSASRRRRRSRAWAAPRHATAASSGSGPLLLLAGLAAGAGAADRRHPAGGLCVGGAAAARRHRLRAGVRGPAAALDARRRATPLRCWRCERARHERSSATIAVAGVVASLALAVALTVMVASFRESVTQWLDTVLPADLYVRSAAGSAAATRSFCRAGADRGACAQLPGVARVEAAARRRRAARPAAPGRGADRARRWPTRRSACRWSASCCARRAASASAST